MLKKIERLFFNLINLESFDVGYRKLDNNGKNQFKNIIDRLIFDIYLEDNLLEICKFVNPKFIRSLQGYLLLSCGDALGEGSKYYSIHDYIFHKINPEREEKIDQFLNTNVYNEKTVKTFLKSILNSYSNRQSVKQSFMSFWNARSAIIKQKMFSCYNTPFDPSERQPYSDQGFGDLIKKRLYEVYRNPFTHKAENNFPLLTSDLRLIQDDNLAKAVIWTEFHRADGKIFEFRVPLSYEEAEKIHSMDGTFHYRLLDNSLIPLEKPRHIPTIIHYALSSRGGTPDKDRKGNLNYVHPGTLEVFRMAIAEACCEVLGCNINWLAQYD